MHQFKYLNVSIITHLLYKVSYMYCNMCAYILMNMLLTTSDKKTFLNV